MEVINIDTNNPQESERNWIHFLSSFFSNAVYIRYCYLLSKSTSIFNSCQEYEI